MKEDRAIDTEERLNYNQIPHSKFQTVYATTKQWIKNEYTYNQRPHSTFQIFNTTTEHRTK